MKIKNSIVIFLLTFCFVMVGCLLPAGAAEVVAAGTCGDRLTWSLTSDGVLTVGGAGAMTGTDSNPPWLPVRDKIKTLIVEDGVTSIGETAFRNSENLAALSLPGSLTEIGAQAFSGCAALREIALPEGLTRLGQNAFLNCSALETISFPDSLNDIGLYVFGGTPWYDNQPEGVVYAGKVALTYNGTLATGATLSFAPGTVGVAAGAFSGKTGLQEVELPDSIVCIGEDAFKDCSLLNIRSLPAGLRTIGEAAFDGCRVSVSTLPDGLREIGDQAFRGADLLFPSGMTSIVIPDSVRVIGANAFAGRSALETISLPQQLEHIGENAFSSTAWYNAQPDGVLYLDGYALGYKGTLPENAAVSISPGTRLLADKLFYDCANLTEITLPDSLRMIGNRTFWKCAGLQRVTVPAGVTEIGDVAFGYCEGLISVSLPDSLTRIGDDAFFYCVSLPAVTLPAGLTSMGYGAFRTCKSLTRIRIPAQTTEIGDCCFAYCSQLEEIEVEAGNASFVSVDGVLFDRAQTTLLQYPPASARTSYAIPSGVTSLAQGALEGANNLTEIRIPASVKTLGLWAFSNCDSIETILLPVGLEKIPAYTFYGCDSLTEIVIPEGVTEIANQAFYNNKTLASVTIPASVRKIDKMAFAGCAALTDVYYGGSEEAFSAMDVVETEAVAAAEKHFNWDTHTPGAPVETTLVPAACCGAGEKLVTVTCTACGETLSETRVRIPATGDHFPGFTAVFDGGTLLLSGSGTFSSAPDPDCVFLADCAPDCTAVVLDAGVRTLGDGVFRGFSALEEVVSYAPSLRFGSGVFADCPALETVILFGGANVSNALFADASSGLRIFMPASAAAANAARYTVHPFSWQGGVLTLGGELVLDAYDFLDAVAVFCDHFGTIDSIRVSALRFENVPLYYTLDGKRTPLEDNTLYNGEIRVFVEGGDGKEKQTTFNAVCSGIADGSVRRFSFVTTDDVHSEPAEAHVSIIERISAGIKKVLGFIVSLLNRLFRLLNSFKK